MPEKITDTRNPKVVDYKNLYVGNLPTDMKDKDLEELFQKYGEINSAKIMENKTYGFVFFDREEDAKAAKEGVSKIPWGSEVLKLVVKFHEKSGKNLKRSVASTPSLESKTGDYHLYVKSFPGHVKEENLINKFSNDDRKVIAIKMVQGSLQRRYAFLEFESKEQAKAAMDELNGKPYSKIDNGETLFVTEYIKCTPSDATSTATIDTKTIVDRTKLYVRGLPVDMTDEEFKERIVSSNCIDAAIDKKRPGNGILWFASKEATKEEMKEAATQAKDNMERWDGRKFTRFNGSQEYTLTVMPFKTAQPQLPTEAITLKKEYEDAKHKAGSDVLGAHLFPCVKNIISTYKKASTIRILDTVPHKDIIRMMFLEEEELSQKVNEINAQIEQEQAAKIEAAA